MKKVIFSLGCSMLMGTFCMAQQATIAPASSPDSAPAAVVAPQVIEATAQTPAPEPVPTASVVAQETVDSVASDSVVNQTAEVPVAGAEIIVNDASMVIGTPIEAAPIYTGQMTGQVIEGQTYPELTSPAIVNGDSFGQTVISSAPVMDQSFVATPVNAAPVMGTSVMGSPVMGTSVVGDSVLADPFAAPFAAPAETASAACVDCQPNGRRQIIRTVTTRGRSVFTRIRTLSRVRALVGRRR